MRIFVSWIGSADLAAYREDSFNGVGPVGATLRTQNFDRAVLLANQPSADVDDYTAWLRSRAPGVRITTHSVPVSGPSTFAEVFACVASLLDNHVAEPSGAVDAALYLSLGNPVEGATPCVLNRPLGGIFNLKTVQAELNRHYIERALDQAQGGISQAARLLGTSRQNLTNWIKEMRRTDRSSD